VATVATIEQAVKRAVELRGTVMLAARENERQWCAVCAAVDGSLELRVGEPGSVWRRRERHRGEAWLRDHGFVQVIDAWAKPVRCGTSPRSCARTEAALREGLAAPEGADFVEALVHPGAIGSAEPPPPEASHAEHIRFALVALARRRDGKLSIEGGRPASTWGWAFAMDDELILSPESPDHEWRVPLTDEDAADAAVRLTDVLHKQPGRDRHGSLFISFMPLHPTDPPLR
jgi:hypothetical protein